MDHELTVALGTATTNVFLQNGFYSSSVASTHMHRHNYTEIHIVSGGEAQAVIDNRTKKLSDGNILAVPPGRLHTVSLKDKSTRHTAFQIGMPIARVCVQKVSPQIVKAFFEEITNCRSTNDYTNIAAFISLLCGNLFPEHRVTARNVKNTSFIITEFFSNNYGSDVTLGTLAEMLHLSEKQTERLVIKTMGCTFKKALANVRTDTADHLIKTTDMTLTEVAEYVGYHSYSGFWKAYRKHTEN